MANRKQPPTPQRAKTDAKHAANAAYNAAQNAGGAPAQPALNAQGFPNIQYTGQAANKAPIANAAGVPKPQGQRVSPGVYRQANGSLSQAQGSPQRPPQPPIQAAAGAAGAPTGSPLPQQAPQGDWNQGFGPMQFQGNQQQLGQQYNQMIGNRGPFPQQGFNQGYGNPQQGGGQGGYGIGNFMQQQMGGQGMNQAYGQPQQGQGWQRGPRPAQPMGIMAGFPPGYNQRG